jgi:hypothetical protein
MDSVGDNEIVREAKKIYRDAKIIEKKAKASPDNPNGQLNGLISRYTESTFPLTKDQERLK